MAFSFKLDLSVLVGRGTLANEKESIMSDGAKRLAEEVNKRQADKKVKAELQLHKAKVLSAKRYAFWNDFVILFRREFNDFNNSLDDSEFRIEEFDDTSVIYTITLRGGKDGTTARIECTEQLLSASGERPGKVKQLNEVIILVVDDEDNIHLKDGEGNRGWITQSEFALRVLRFFAAD